MDDIKRAGKAIVDGIPEQFRMRYRKRAMEAPVSYPAAVATKCLDCCGWSYKEVQLCPVEACPLHALRARLFASRSEKDAVTSAA